MAAGSRVVIDESPSAVSGDLGADRRAPLLGSLGLIAAPALAGSILSRADRIIQ